MPWRLGARCGGGTASAGRQGSVKQKVELRPAVLCRRISPSIRATRWLEIDSPRPVPPNRRVVELSAWEKASKMWRWASGAILMPVSRTEKHRVSAMPGHAWVPRRTCSSTSPFSRTSRR